MFKIKLYVYNQHNNTLLYTPLLETECEINKIRKLEYLIEQINK